MKLTENCGFCHVHQIGTWFCNNVLRLFFFLVDCWFLKAQAVAFSQKLQQSAYFCTFFSTYKEGENLEVTLAMNSTIQLSDRPSMSLLSLRMQPVLKSLCYKIGGNHFDCLSSCLKTKKQILCFALFVM